ncbi:hypothetical protein U1Q18_027579 [Sarracenia purpurea var. burkii]
MSANHKNISTYVIESPISTRQAFGDSSYDQRSANRKLWRRYENGGVDVSLKDGLYSEVARGSAIENSDCDDFFSGKGDCMHGFAGFLQGSPRNRFSRSTTPSPQVQAECLLI